MSKKRNEQSEAQVADFWLNHDSAGLIDWKKNAVALEFDPGAEKPSQSVTIRLPGKLFRDLRTLAKERDVPYQSLMKMLLADKVLELQKKAG